MKYISLFSGIGAFEYAIHSLFPDAECLAYSEIDPYAIRIYSSHFPTHKNLGDVTKITEKTIRALGPCDLVVGGFPCVNLSSMANLAGDNKGLKGAKSKLFYDLVRVIRYVMKRNPNVRFIIENNNSMRISDKASITETLKKYFSPVYDQMIDNSIFALQRRKRILWSNFKIPAPYSADRQTWTDVLEPMSQCLDCILPDKSIQSMNKLFSLKTAKGETIVAVKTRKARGAERQYNTYKFKTVKVSDQKSRWQSYALYSDTLQPYCRTILASPGSVNNILVDRRVGHANSDILTSDEFIVRRFTLRELERLFGFPDGWTSSVSDLRRRKALGNSIPIFIVGHSLTSLVS